MKLKKLMLTGVLVCGLIFAGCGSTSKGNSGKEDAVNSDVQDAWDDISGDGAETETGDDEEEETDTENITDESDAENATVTEDIDTSWYDSNGDAIASGIFIVGENMAAGTYEVSNPKEDQYMDVIVFESMDDYLGYFSTYPKSTLGEEDDAIKANSFYDTCLNPEESCTVNLEDGNVLMINGAIGSIVNSENTNVGDGVISEMKELKPGVYSSKQIGEGTYIITYPTDGGYGTKIALFDNADLYKKYNSTDTVTLGDRDEAIWTNGVYDFDIEEGKPCFIEMKADSVLLVFDYDHCYIQKVDMNWSQE